MKRLTLLVMICLLPMKAVALEAIKEIVVVSEELEDGANRDGTGLYWDIVRMVFEPEGIKVIPKTTPYARSVHLVRVKSADAWLGAYLEEEDFPIYPEWHYDADNISAIFKLEDVSEWRGEASLEGKTVAWLRDYDYDQYLGVSVRKKEVNHRKSGLGMLEKGRIDFFLDARADLKAELDKGYLQTGEYGIETFLNLKLYPAFVNSERGRRLQEVWDRRMQELHDDEAFKQLYEKWDYTEYPDVFRNSRR